MHPILAVIDKLKVFTVNLPGEPKDRVFAIMPHLSMNTMEPSSIILKWMPSKSIWEMHVF
jgi:hypothetical protein